MTSLFKDAIDEAVRERNIEFLISLIRRDKLAAEIREHLATVIEGLLTKKISFPSRKPKQNLEEKHQAIAERVWEVKKNKGWKLRSVVDSVAKEKQCCPKTVWTAWCHYGPALIAGELLRGKYDLDGLFAFMAAGRNEKKPSFGKLTNEEMNTLNNLVQDSLAIIDSLPRNKPKVGRCKKVSTKLQPN